MRSLGRFLVAGMLWLVSSFPLLAQTASDSGETIFDLQRLSKAPAVSPAVDIPSEGVNAIFYEGVRYRGNPTKVFAYYGLPSRDSQSQPAEKVPGVVLIHGGGGTAFANWVKLWNSRGYAAIAMDVCGCVPVGTYGNWQRHTEGGPPGWDASFMQIDEPVEDQWQTHAVSAVLLAHSLLRSMPEVDSECIGVTGISWGGYLTCIVAGVDDRFKSAVPVYGCGYLGDNSVWLPTLESIGKERAEKWLKRWDPSVYLHKTMTPMLWVNGTNDFAYPMDSWQRSARLHRPSTLSLRVRMPHGHGVAGENPEEIHVFMNSILKGGAIFPSFEEVHLDGPTATARFRTKIGIEKAELCYTKDSGKWQDRHWATTPAKIENDRMSAEIPADAQAWYFNLFDERECVVSTEHTERTPAIAR